MRPLLLLALPLALFAGMPEAYVTRALEANHALAQADADAKTRAARAAEAKAALLPSLAFSSRYTKSEGGRSALFPVGDLLNPVYQAIGSPVRLNNEEILFQPEKEQETKLVLTQLLYHPAVSAGADAAGHLAASAAQQARGRARALVAEVKSAYYRYRQAEEAVEIYRTLEALLEENLRVSRVLVETGKATEDAVLRMEAETAANRLSLARSERDALIARAVFNRLLARPLESEVETPELEPPVVKMGYDRALVHAFTHREELAALHSGVLAGQSGIDAADAGLYPTLAARAEGGSLGENYALGEEERFWNASLLLSWNLYDGGAKQEKIEAAQLEKRSLAAGLEEAKSLIELEVKQAWEGRKTAFLAVEAADRRLASLESAYEIVRKKYAYGAARQVELLDALAALTAGKTGYASARYELLTAQAVLERAAALTPLPEGETR